MPAYPTCGYRPSLIMCKSSTMLWTRHSWKSGKCKLKASNLLRTVRSDRSFALWCQKDAATSHSEAAASFFISECLVRRGDSGLMTRYAVNTGSLGEDQQEVCVLKYRSWQQRSQSSVRLCCWCFLLNGFVRKKLWLCSKFSKNLCTVIQF